MSFYDWNQNFYGNSTGPNAAAPAYVPKTDEMRDSRRQFHKFMRRGVLDPNSTMNARMGQSNLILSDSASPEMRNKVNALRQDVSSNVNYGMAQNQPTYYAPHALNPDAKNADLRGFRNLLVDRFKNPADDKLMPMAPSWMSSQRANDVLEKVSGRFNNALPYNANPYQQSQGRIKGGQPS